MFSSYQTKNTFTVKNSLQKLPDGVLIKVTCRDKERLCRVGRPHSGRSCCDFGLFAQDSRIARANNSGLPILIALLLIPSKPH